MNKTENLSLLLQEIRACQVCAKGLPLGVNPVVTAHQTSKVVIIGQAPGTKVHRSGIPWDDASGNRLRTWLNVDKETFYDTRNFAIIPMGFCYPGKGKTGDLPPRRECAPLWHKRLLEQLPNVQLVLLIGQYAQTYYLGKSRGKNLTETVRNYEAYLPKFFPLPHPSPRNRYWLSKNPWFDEEVIWALRGRLSEVF